MAFTLSKRSLARLEGVDADLVAVVKRAIELTKVDFGVTEGLRSLETQKKYVAAGKSQTMNSKHITGDAVDVVAYIEGDNGPEVAWELNLYDDIADAFKQAAIELGVSLRWGAAWNVPDITKWEGTMNEAMCHYIDERRKANRKPFIDGPHFEKS